MAGLSIEQRAIDELIPYARNPRKNDDSVSAIAASIKEYGWTQPIVAAEDGTIIAGHTRLKAAKLLGLETVPVYTPKKWTDEQAKAYRIADNKLAELSGWDVDLLKLELSELTDLGAGRLSLGFDEHELKSLLDGVNFEPGTEDDQGKLDELAPKMVQCPHCHEKFDLREHG